jgi:hypothetical protein
MTDIAMIAYINKLTVLELVTRLEDWAVTNVIGGRSQVYPERDELVAALRKAVVREASVGTVYVARNAPHECPEFRFTCPKNLTGLSGNDMCQLCSELLPERTYDLISKETP